MYTNIITRIQIREMACASDVLGGDLINSGARVPDVHDAYALGRGASRSHAFHLATARPLCWCRGCVRASNLNNIRINLIERLRRRRNEIG